MAVRVGRAVRAPGGRARLVGAPGHRCTAPWLDRAPPHRRLAGPGRSIPSPARSSSRPAGLLSRRYGTAPRLDLGQPLPRRPRQRGLARRPRRCASSTESLVAIVSLGEPRPFRLRPGAVGRSIGLRPGRRRPAGDGRHLPAHLAARRAQGAPGRPPPQPCPSGDLGLRRSGSATSGSLGGGQPDRAGHAGAAQAAVAVRVLGQVLLVVALGEVERRRPRRSRW